MHPLPSLSRRLPPLRPLAACLALACAGTPTSAAIPPAAVPAGGVLPVTSCADDGSAGTLRQVIQSAVSGDTVDLSGLACGTIVLSGGALLVEVDDLAVQGPGTDLTLDGNASDSVIVHYAGGTLEIRNLTIANGSYDGGGGCVFSEANVVLDHVSVHGCRGGSEYGAGGGVLALGDLTIDSSTLAGNSALVGGGAVADGAVEIRNSTLSGNNAEFFGGAIYHGGPAAAGGRLHVLNSTITANTAAFAGGGIYVGYDPDISIESSVVAGNDAGNAADLGGFDPLPVDGSHNLIDDSSFTLPGDTLQGDPMLGPLADNGGATLTHSPQAGSPLVDAGSNPGNLVFDQRGEGYPRSLGVAPDIGAVELAPPDDTIFRDGFDEEAAGDP